MKYRCGWVLVVAAALVGEVGAQVPPGAAESAGAVGEATAKNWVVYQSAFEREAGAEWSKKTVAQSPSGKHTFLGPLSNESTTLALDKLPEHGRVRLSFDLMIMLTWDGDYHLDQPGSVGPDLFDVTVERGPRLVHASFVCYPLWGSVTQSFPGRFPYDHQPGGTGASEKGTLGYQNGGNAENVPEDCVYHIERSFMHSGKTLKIIFSGINLQGAEDEAWGLENVKVEFLPAGATSRFDEATFGKMWTDLGSEDAKAFVPAIEGMINLGDPGATALRKRLAPAAPETDQERAIGKLVAQLDDDAYTVREKASDALAGMGPAAEPALRAAREKAVSQEVVSRIDVLLERLKGGQPESAEERRRRRLVEVFERIGTPEARRGLGDIGRQQGTLAAWEADTAIKRLEGKAEIPTQLDLPPGLVKARPAAPDVEDFVPGNALW